MTTKCDIIRDVGNANNCGMCTALGASPPGPIPSGCTVGGVTPPTAACQVTGTANTRMKLFEMQYSPANIFETGAAKDVRVQSEKNFQAGILKTEAALAAAYPNAAAGATSISWPDLERCLWNADGSPGGSNGNKYFKRDDLLQMGMTPVYPLGGAFAEDTIWKAGTPSPIPVTVDYAMNPDLFAILMFALLVIVFAALMWAAWRTKRRAPYLAQQKADAEHRRLEATDPYRGTAFESYPDPGAKCRKYVDAMEQQGYDMSYYRRQCGMPAKS